MALTVVLGLVCSLVTLFISLALLVRTSLGRGNHAITLLPAPLVLYNAWMTAWFVFECLRQFVLTSMTPATALRLVAFVFLVASLLSVSFVYACLSAVDQILGARATRRVRRVAKHLALIYGALLIVGWSAYQFNADSRLFSWLRAGLSAAALPLSLAAWGCLLYGTARIADGAWRAKLTLLARRYVVLFAVAALAAILRDRIEAIGSALPLAIDIVVLVGYSLLTVAWVEWEIQ